MSTSVDLLPRPAVGVWTAPLVLAIVGTDHHPFDRLMGWAQRFADEGGELATFFVQSGTSTPSPKTPSAAYVSHEDLEAMLQEARAVVCHAGPGTIMDARRFGHVPVVVPREHARGEHVDDHQVRFATRLGGTGQIRLARDATAFSQALLDALAEGPRPAVRDNPSDRPIDRFETLVDDLLSRGGPRPRLSTIVRRLRHVA